MVASAYRMAWWHLTRSNDCMSHVFCGLLYVELLWNGLLVLAPMYLAIMLLGTSTNCQP
jgi:hypothetical protein